MRDCHWVTIAVLVGGFVLSASASGRTLSESQVALEYACSGLAGAAVFAPKWEHEADGASNQEVRVVFGGDGQPASISWQREGVDYYKSPGVGFSLASGFAVLVLEPDRLETYVYSAGTTELLFTQTRVGNAVLPNSMKVFRGVCRPAGKPVS